MGGVWHWFYPHYSQILHVDQGACDPGALAPKRSQRLGDMGSKKWPKTGWWLTYPSEKYEFVTWDDYPQDQPNVPNHQPEMSKNFGIWSSWLPNCYPSQAAEPSRSMHFLGKSQIDLGLCNGDNYWQLNAATLLCTLHNLYKMLEQI